MSRYFIFGVLLIASLSFVEVSLSNEIKLTSAQKQARDEIDSIRPLAKSMTFDYFTPEARLDAKKVYTRAMRAWNLDPANEEAGYYACISYLSNHEYKTNSSSKYSRDVYQKTDKLCQKYLELFGKRNLHHYYEITLLRQICLRSFGDMKTQYEIFLELVMLELEHHKLARASCPMNFLVWLEYICERMPLGQLKQAYEVWDKFIEQQYKPFLIKRDGTLYKEAMTRESCPELLEATYWAHMKKTQKTRDALSKAASIYPEKMQNAWRSPMHHNAKDTIANILKISGDPQWKTWQPKFTTTLPLINKNQTLLESIASYLKRNNPTFWDTWEKYLPRTEKLPLVAAKIQVIPDVKPKITNSRYRYDTYMYMPIGLLGKDQELFFSRVLRANADGHDVFLYYANRKSLIAKEKSPTVKLTNIPWPDYPIPSLRQNKREQHYIVTDYYVQTQCGVPKILWVGTDKYGLVRFDYNDKNGKWQGKWITIRDGLPQKSIVCGLFPTNYKGKKGLLVSVKYEAHVKGIQYMHVWSNYFIDTDALSMTLLNKVSLPCIIKFKNAKQAILSPSGPAVGSTNLQSWNNLQAAPEATDIELLKKNDLNGAVFEKFPGFWWYKYYMMHLSDDVYFAIDCFIDVKRKRSFSFFKEFNGWHGRGRMHEQISGLRIRPKLPYLLPNILFAFKSGKYICFVVNNHKTYRANCLLLIWKPGSDSTMPLKGDAWFGPFALPEKKEPLSISRDPTGCVWMRLQWGELYKLDISKSVKNAKAKGCAWDSEELKQSYIKLLSHNGWRFTAHYLLAEKQQNKTIAFLNREIDAFKSAGDLQSQCDAMMFKAAALSFSAGNFNAAIEVYKQVLKIANDPGIRYLAQRNMGIIYLRDRQYQKCIETLEKLPRGITFSHATYADGRLDTQLGNSINTPVEYFINQAKSKIKKSI